MTDHILYGIRVVDLMCLTLTHTTTLQIFFVAFKLEVAMYHTMSLLQLIELRSWFQQQHNIALKQGNQVRRWQILNKLRAINAEIVVAQVERR